MDFELKSSAPSFLLLIDLEFKNKSQGLNLRGFWLIIYSNNANYQEQAIQLDSKYGISIHNITSL